MDEGSADRMVYYNLVTWTRGHGKKRSDLGYILETEYGICYRIGLDEMNFSLREFQMQLMVT